MTNDRPVNILPLINYNIYWPIIGYLYYMTPFFVRHNKLFSNTNKFSMVNVYLSCAKHGLQLSYFYAILLLFDSKKEKNVTFSRPILIFYTEIKVKKRVDP